MPNKRTNENLSSEQVKKACQEEGLLLIEDCKFGKEDYVSVQSSWPNLMRFVKRVLKMRGDGVSVVEEHYLKKCLDSTVYQSVLIVQFGHEKIVYRHDIRLWSEEFIGELRDREKRKAHEYIMNQIRVRLFGSGA